MDLEALKALGLDDENAKKVFESMEQSKSAAVAEYQAKADTYKSQVEGLEGVKAKLKAEAEEKERALAEATGDYTKLAENIKNTYEEKLANERTEKMALLKEKVDREASLAQVKALNVFSDNSKALGELAVKSLVQTVQDENGGYTVKYSLPDGSPAESIDDVVKAIKSSDTYAAHVKADVANGGGAPSPKGNGGGKLDPNDPKARRLSIQEKYGLSS